MANARLISGQTLIEALVTVLVVAIGIVALIRFQNYIGYDSALSQQKNDATLIASKQLETLRDYQVLNTTSGYRAYADIVSGTSTVASTNTTYNMSWTVTQFTNPSYKNIDITVSWVDRNNIAQSVTMTTRVARIDPTTSASIM